MPQSTQIPSQNAGLRSELSARSWLLLAIAAWLTLACSNDTTTVGADKTGVDTAVAADELSNPGEDATDAQSTGEDSAADADTTLEPPDSAGDAQGDVGGGECPGGPFCPCAKDSECDSGACVDTAAGKQCSKTCGGAATCPVGWECKLYGAIDPVSMCLPKQVSLCSPCKAHTDCQVGGDKTAWCLDYASNGKFCGATCASDADCPDGYGCAEQKDGASQSKQCRLKDAAAVCTCSYWGTQSGLSTDCQITNNFGTCGGTRSCGPGGLSACSGKEAKAETCNAEDDNCDGKIDNLPVDAVCFKFAYTTGGSGKTCGGDGDCPSGEGCDQATCKAVVGKCPGKPTCTSGGQQVCTDAVTPKKEICNNEDDDCDGLTDEDFSVVELSTGATVGVGQACGAGLCAGGTVQCQTVATALCTTGNLAKSESCNGKDDDCNGQTDDATCADGDACTADSCDPSAAKCSNPPLKNCDDGNPCTGDGCDKVSGNCTQQLLPGSSCSDGDACTVGDQCQADAAGAAVCLAGTASQVCDDGNPCTTDSCDPSKGCVVLANDATAVCYTGGSGTAGVGVCVEGKKLCKDGQFGECLGQILPAGSEACDGADDDCDGFTDEGCKANALEIGLAGLAG
ncbi:MAG: hypothetical protein HY902_07455, partial [Deltaproteobacteria bacterium]|nr:hypothetical protein [Deltaproteobacteria bacterium]